jgi:uncharacterized protein DUF3147
MIVHFRIAALKQNHWYEHAVRFVLGGLTTVLAGVVADQFGPANGGLFLAFPAIFCASATLIEKHERQRKQDKGLRGDRRGQQAAALDSAGAAWGSIGLAAFGLCVWWLAPKSSVITLAVASITWFAVAVLMWRLRSELRIAHHKPKR